ncbi:MAG: hypothetical protein ACRCX8_16675 [Sarcina sp.]
MKKILMTIMVGLSLVLTGCTTGKDSQVTLNENHIGFYTEVSDEGSFSTYELTTPRGKELVAGFKNLDNSINTYIKYDVFGKDVAQLNESQKKRFRVKI